MKKKFFVHFIKISSLNKGWLNKILFVIIPMLFIANDIKSQNTYYWCSPGGSGNWSDANWWFSGTCNNTLPGGEIINFDNTAYTTMTNNASNTNRYRIFFLTNVGSRTIGGTTNNTFYDYSGNTPKIENQYSASQTINFPMTLGWTGGIELNPVSGDLTFGGNINNGGNNINIWGDNGKSITFSAVVSGGGKIIVKQNSLAKITGSSTFTGNVEIDKGEFWVGEGGTLGSGNIYVGNGAQTTTTAKLWISDANGGTTVSRSLYTNSSSGSQYRVLGGLNSSGENTFSGNLSLSGDCSLEANQTGGTIIFSGIISGSNIIVLTGPGKVKLNGENTSTGSLYIVNGTMELNNTTDPLDVPGIVLGETSGSNNATLQIGTASVTIDNPITVRSGSSGTKYIKYTPTSGTGTFNSSATISLQDNTTYDVASGGSLVLSGIISESSSGKSINKTGSGLLTLNANNSYTGTTTITAGTLELGDNDRISNSSNVVLNGGTFSTGASAGKNETVGTLQLNNSSTISLNTGNSHQLNFSNSSSLTWTGTLNITGWQGNPGETGTKGKIFFGNSSSGLTGTQLGKLTFNGSLASMILSTGEIVPCTVPSSLSLNPSGTVSYCTSVQFSCTAGGGAAPFSYQWAKNGTTINNATLSAYTATASGTYTCIVSNSCSTGVTSTGTTLTIDTPPSITTNTTPSSNAICSGGSASYSVAATGSNLSYQWQYSPDNNTFNPASNGTPTGATYTGSTTSNMTVSGVSTGGTYYYRCLISGTCSPAATSTAATLVVTDNAIINSGPSPSNPSVCSGLSTSFTISATGASLSYQWQDNSSGWTNLTTSSIYPNVTSTTLTITDVTGLNNKQYRCIVSSSCGTPQTSTAATLTVNNTLSGLTISPANPSSICSPNSVTFTASASGTTPFTYQWYNGSIISGATTSTYTATATGNYSCVITNVCGGSTSTASSLTVNTPLSNLTVSPANPSPICSPNSLTFTANASGTTPLTYQWYNGTIISGATTSAYSATVTGSYSCVITNTCGSATSTASSLTVNPTVSVTFYTPSSAYTGSSVTISGVGFTVANGVSFGGTAAASYSVISDTQINAIVAAGSSGNVQVNGSVCGSSAMGGFTYLGYITKASGDWNTGTTWLGDGVPPSATTTNVTIAHDVTSTPTASVGQLTVNSSKLLTITAGTTITVSANSTVSGTITSNGTLATAATLTNSGTININGAFQLNQGGYASSNNFNYSSGTLTFNNSSGIYEVDNAHVYWPSSNGPTNVQIIGSAGTRLKTGATRTIAGTLKLNAAFDIQSSSLLTVNGTVQINSNGNISSNPPIYGNGSLLQYNSGSAYSRSTEWTTATSGAGYPYNVQTSTNGTTLNMGSSSAQCAGALTIDASTTVNSPGSSNLLTVLGNVTINGALSLNYDIKTAGNWTVGTSGTLTNNGKAVFFNGTSGDQTIAKTGGGTVYFDYLIVDKSSGNVVISSSPTTDITINSTSGDVLQLINNGQIDLNGRSITFNNSGGNIKTIGSRTITSSVAGGKMEFNQYKTISGGTLAIGSNITVNMNANGNVDFGSGVTTINGTLSINSNTSCYVNTNPPIFGNGSLLKYNSGGTYGRGLEWSNTSGPGYPNDVQISNNTTLNYPNGDNTDRSIAHDLTIDGGSYLYMDWGGGYPKLTVGRNILIIGLLKLGNSGGDLFVAGNFTNNGTFDCNGRAVYFNGSSNQTLSGSGAVTINYMFLNNSAGLSLNRDLTVANNLTFTSGKITLGTNNLTINSGASISSYDASKYIVTDNTGYLIRNVASSEVAYPIGTSSVYAPAYLKQDGNSENLYVRVKNSIDNALFDANKAVQLQWTLNESNAGNNTITTKFQWNYAQQGASFNGGGIVQTGRYISSYTLSSATVAGSDPYTATSTGMNSTLNAVPFVVGNTSAFIAAPGISTFTPSSAYTGGTVTITGTNFTGATSVTFGGTSASSFNVDNDGQITAYIAGGTSGTVTVTGPSGSDSKAGFTYNGYISNASADWNAGSTWLGGSVPPAGSAVTINHGVSVTATVSNVPATVTVNSGKSLTFGSSGSLTIASGGTITNNGSIDMASGGTLKILNNGILNNQYTFNSGTGTVVFFANTTTDYIATVTGTIGFNNVMIAGTGNPGIEGVSFSGNSTINGTLSINTYSYVSSAPKYAASSTLKYNTGGTFGRSTEWSTTSGNGYPGNVQVSNSTVLDIGANSGTGTVFQIAGSLYVDNLSTFSMNESGHQMTKEVKVVGSVNNNGTITLSGLEKGDLYVGGNWNNSGTFNDMTRAVFFNGSSQSINSPTTFSYPIISSSGTVTLNTSIIVPNQLEIGSGTLQLGVNNSISGNLKKLKLNGGVLNTEGYNVTFGQLVLNNDAAITLGNGSHTINFDNSDMSWTNGKFLTINNWQGTGGQSGTAGRIFFPNNTGLNGTQLSMITFTGYDAAPAILLNSGELVAPCTLASRPSTLPSSLSFPIVGAKTIKLTWSNGNGANRIVVIRAGSSVSATPTDRVAYTASSDYSNPGSDLGSYQYVVFNGSGNNVTVNNLDLNTAYYFKIFEYNGTGCDNAYLTASAPSANTSTYNFYPSSTDGNWSSATTWIDGVPPPGASVVIYNNVILDDNRTALNVTINSGKSLSSASGGKILTLTSGATFTNNGTFTANDGTVSFSGSGSVSGTVTFNDVNVTGGGVNFGTASTVNGTLTLGSSGYVDTNAPYYADNSTLKYSTDFQLDGEWYANKIDNSQGIPYNVVIDGGNVYMASGATSWRGLRGTLTINTGNTFSLASEPLAIGGDLHIKGNFINNGTFNTTLRSIGFYGTSSQTITTGPSSTTNLDYVDINSAGVSLQNLRDNNIDIRKQLKLSGGILTIGASNSISMLYTYTRGGDGMVNGGDFSDITATGGSFASGANGGTIICKGKMDFYGDMTLNKLILRNENNVGLGYGANFHTNLTNNTVTINGTMQIEANGFADVNAPYYATNSTLIYTTNGNYDRRVEWSSSSGAGYPYHVLVTNNTNLNLGFEYPGTARQCAGNLTIDNNASIYMDNPAMTQPLTVMKNLYLSGSLTLSTSVGGDFNIAGNFINNGTFNHNSRAVKFFGSTEQTIGGNNSTNFAYLILDNSSATGVTLAKDISLNNRITFTNGRMNTDDVNLFTMKEGSFAEGYDYTKYDNINNNYKSGATDDSYVNGPMVKVGNTDFIFPIGGNTPTYKFHCLGIYFNNPTSNPPNQFKAKYNNANPQTVYGSSRDAIFYKISDEEYWDLQRYNSQGSDAVTVQLRWRNLRCWSPQYLRVAHYNSGTSKWENLGQGEVTGIKGDNSYGTIKTSAPVSSFSPFAMGTTYDQSWHPLPIELISFTGVAEKNDIRLNWATATETNNDYFILEKSTDAVSFTDIARVKGAGNSNKVLSYQYYDETPYSGLNYYRLKQTDFDGAYEYSGIISVLWNKDKNTPGISSIIQKENSLLSITFNSATDGLFMIEIYDLNGRRLLSDSRTMKSGLNTVEENTNTLNPGIYFIRIINRDKVYMQKFLVK